jgi:DNA-binding NarL/FixJ family response regulator
VLGWVAEGLGNKEIADRLGTVKNQIQAIGGELKAADRTQAVTIAIWRGILHLD